MTSKNKRGRRRGVRHLENPPPLSLTSLMDVVTNILVYTIKIFAVSPITVQDPSVALPRSSSREDAADAVVVMVTGAQRAESKGDSGTEVVQEIPTIVVDGKVIQRLDRETYRVPAEAKQRGYIITSLKKELLEIRKSQGQTAQLTEGEGFTGNIVIIADKYTPYRVLADVLVTCGQAGFGDFKFAIVKQDA
jgi:biopolymer transport protein ExbD